MLTSTTSGWNPDQQRYATATSLAGPWTTMADVRDATATAPRVAVPGPGQRATTGSSPGTAASART
jgi:hypothetical protein